MGPDHIFHGHMWDSCKSGDPINPRPVIFDPLHANTWRRPSTDKLTYTTSAHKLLLNSKNNSELKQRIKLEALFMIKYVKIIMYQRHHHSGAMS